MTWASGVQTSPSATEMQMRTGTSALRGWEWALLVLLLAVFAGQALHGSPQKSASFDEQYHLTAGYSYLRTGDFRLATTHPPLAGMVAGLPLLWFEGINLPLDDPLWEQANRYDFSDLFLWRANSDPQGMLVAARRGITFLGVLLLAGLFFWGRRLLGVTGGWLVLLLAIFDPNLVANSRIISTDLPLTAFFALGMWRLWCWLEGERGGSTQRRGAGAEDEGEGLTLGNKGAEARAWRWRPAYDLVLAGVLGGLTMAAKYNGLLFWVVAALGALLYTSSPDDFRIAIKGWWRRLAGVTGAGIIGLMVLWAVYRFQWGVPQVLPFAAPLPAPFYWDNLYTTFAGLVQETTVKPDFLLGQVSTGGWWYYFPVAIAVKMPLPTLVLVIAGLAALVHKRDVRRQALLWLPLITFVAMGLSGILTIGFRHMLPAVPFALLLAGNAANWAYGSGTRTGGEMAAGAPAAISPPVLVPLRVAAGGLLLLWLVVGTLRIHPHQEAYFNTLAGPWQNWSNLLVDSNLDWGQDLPSLAEVMAKRGIQSVALAYFGKAVPEAYGITYRPLPGYLRFMQGREIAAYNPYTPEPGWYAISATSLRLGTLQPDTTDLYAAFRDMQPVDRAGYSIYLYHVEDEAQTQIVRPVVVDTPVFQVAADDLGVAPTVRAAVKWLQNGSSSVYPQGEGWSPPSGPLYQAVNADLGGVMTLLGYELAQDSFAPGQSLEITLYWRVGERRMPQPGPTRGEAISAFVHLVDGDPANQVAQADGWEVALAGLEAGDVISRRMTLDLGPDVASKEYTLLAGLYSPQDWARLPVTQAGREAADHVVLGTILVE